ncbi:hypothetical protein BO94DRAFT_344104 [Aspergillus sclerotioniger CBS 115572]|uniref:Uncharacterized protein n=1 Tax=Aspergillus sclerotioniger CBS 115572 TaxID=1450535 RepID=A0A317X579_9EURO|nr:hypothetical protein BO94DRAFT_344104 [Aspergillus sclerotioniger CBS 115572]PWY93485.1 hypothetical protein BO94DRAFT_344104 [Aspergillus sclerotioniger CBS 115572]
MVGGCHCSRVHRRVIESATRLSIHHCIPTAKKSIRCMYMVFAPVETLPVVCRELKPTLLYGHIFYTGTTRLRPMGQGTRWRLLNPRASSHCVVFRILAMQGWRARMNHCL